MHRRKGSLQSRKEAIMSKLLTWLDKRRNGPIVPALQPVRTDGRRNGADTASLPKRRALHSLSEGYAPSIVGLGYNQAEEVSRDYATCAELNSSSSGGGYSPQRVHKRGLDSPLLQREVVASSSERFLDLRQTLWRLAPGRYLRQPLSERNPQVK